MSRSLVVLLKVSLLGLGVSTAALLTACGHSASKDDNQPAENAATITNPCIAPWVVQGIKDNVIKRSRDTSINVQGDDPISQALLRRVKIGVDYISEPSRREDGRVDCSAYLDIRYLGDEGSAPDIASQIFRILNSGIYSDTLALFGIDAEVISRFSELRGNRFLAPIYYDIGTSYDESGNQNQSYNVGDIGSAAAMIAAMIEIDKENQADVAMMAHYDGFDDVIIEEPNGMDATWETANRRQSMSDLPPKPEPTKAPTTQSTIRVRDDYAEDTVVIEEPAATNDDDSYDYETVEVYEENY